MPASDYRKEYRGAVLARVGCIIPVKEAEIILGVQECREISRVIRAQLGHQAVSIRTFGYTDITPAEAVVLSDSSSVDDIKIYTGWPKFPGR
ncbi:MAG: hypothetical protein ACYCX4_01185 [Bacillota bacterium]